MAKIGTAHLEIKPVINEDSLDALCARIEQRIREAVARGLNVSPAPYAAPTTSPTIVVQSGSTWSTGGTPRVKK